MERSALLDRLRAFFAAYPLPLVAVWLFGSQARGDAHPESDVDVAVLLASPTTDPYDSLMLSIDLATAIERDLDGDVDVVV